MTSAGAMLPVLLVSATLHAQNDFHVSCLPDKAVAHPGESLGVTVWVAADAAPVTSDVVVRWSVSTGRVDEQSSVAHWLLTGAAIDQRASAHVDVTVHGAPVGTCSFGVWIAVEPSAAVRLRGEYIARRAFLRAGEVGEAGFGLYSYFLMREPSSDMEKGRAAAFIGAFLEALVAVADQENFVERRQLNGSYLPISMSPPQDLPQQEQAAWVLGHYDYEHAKRLLSLYPMLSGPGPFIVAVPEPLRAPVKPMLPWDLSQLDSRNTAEGVNRFVNQAAQLYDWQDQATLPKLREQVLTAVAGMFVGRAAAERWIELSR